MRRAVINVACGSWYPDGQKRMVNAIKQHGYDDELMLWTNVYPKNSPTHKQVPYAFKVYAFLEAFEAGYDEVLWLDCSLIAIRPIDEIFSNISEHGYYGVFDNQKVGEWLSDDAMIGMSIEDRTFWMQQLSLLIGCFGLKNDEAGRAFLETWKCYADDGKTFHGKSENDGTVSGDVRVKGTRWEQTSASVIFHRLNWKGVHPPDDNMIEDGHGVPNEKTIFICCRRCSAQ
jgi:hypothetical protein